MKQNKILLIDNNDSFTYNIVDILRKFSSITFEVIKYNEISIEKTKMYNKIIISPGPGLPRNFTIINKIIKEYYSKKPILGICLGHQAIGESFGAKLYNNIPVVHGQPKKIKIINKTALFKGLPDIFTVGLYHSWAIEKENFPDNLEISAISKDNVIMAIKHKEYDIYGIQFHPESYITEFGENIINNFIKL